MSNNFPRRLFWVFLFYLLEVTFVARLGGFAPPLVLAAVMGIGLESGAAAGLLWGAAAGMLFEPFGSGPVGAFSFAYAAAGWATGTLTSKMFGESLWVRALWPCFALAAAAALEAAWGRPPQAGAGFWDVWTAAVPPQRLAATALLSPWAMERMRPARSRRRPRAVLS